MVKKVHHHGTLVIHNHSIMSIEGPKKIESLTEEQIKDRLYSAIESTYKYVMFSTGVKWLGYRASIGFWVEGFEVRYPSLQKLLSMLHLAKDTTTAEEYKQLFRTAIEAIRNFDYKEEVLPEYHQEFLDLDCPAIIENVVTKLEEALVTVGR